MTNITTKSGIKEYISSKDFYCSTEVFEQAELVFTKKLDAACKRASANGRKTVMAKDL